MNDKLNAAVEVLIAKLEDQERQVIETKKMINSLLEMTGKEPRFQDVELKFSHKNLKPDVFYGKPLATAAREYLEFKGSACQVEDILEGLIVGGYDFEWKDKDRLRNLAINISKNSAVFHKLPNGMIGLLTWYPEAQKKKNKTQNHVDDESIESNEINTQEDKQQKLIEKVEVDEED